MGFAPNLLRSCPCFSPMEMRLAILRLREQPQTLILIVVSSV
nr:MAG TPA: hypothetical protein [Caudoviricetes sp.]